MAARMMLTYWRKRVRTLTLDTSALAALASKMVGAPVEVTTCENPKNWGSAARPTKDSYIVRLNPKLLRQGNRKYLQFVFWHEVGHCVLNHPKLAGEPSRSPMAILDFLERREIEADEFAARCVEVFKAAHPNETFWGMFIEPYLTET